MNENIRFIRYNDLILFDKSKFLQLFDLSNNVKSSLDNDTIQSIIQNEQFKALQQKFPFKRVALIEKIHNDDFRTPNVQLIYGPNDHSPFNPWVTQIDNGIKYTFDITRTMFCKGNISEKIRVSKFDCQNEIVVDLFAGIGYFSLIFAKHCKAKHVYCCEWNPAAIEALRKNIRLNNLDENRITICEGDNRLVCPKNVANRVYMGLIPTSLQSLEIACEALNLQSTEIEDFYLHVHENVNYFDAIKQSNDDRDKREVIDDHRSKWAKDLCLKIKDILLSLNNGYDYDVFGEKIVRIKRYAPHIDHMVVDVCIRRKKLAKNSQ